MHSDTCDVDYLVLADSSIIFDLTRWILLPSWTTSPWSPPQPAGGATGPASSTPLCQGSRSFPLILGKAYDCRAW